MNRLENLYINLNLSLVKIYRHFLTSQLAHSHSFIQSSNRNPNKAVRVYNIVVLRLMVFNKHITPS